MISYLCEGLVTQWDLVFNEIVAELRQEQQTLTKCERVNFGGLRSVADLKHTDLLDILKRSKHPKSL